MTRCPFPPSDITAAADSRARECSTTAASVRVDLRVLPDASRKTSQASMKPRRQAMAPPRKTTGTRAAAKTRNAATRRRDALNEEIAADGSAMARAAPMDAAATIDAAFKDDTKVRETFSQNYRE